MQFIHPFLHPVIHSFMQSFTQSDNTYPPSYSWFCLNSYFYHLLCTPYAEKADFFPQKLDSSCLTPPSPLYSPPSISSFCLSAVKGNNQAPITDHQPQRQRKGPVKKRKFDKERRSCRGKKTGCQN